MVRLVRVLSLLSLALGSIAALAQAPPTIPVTGNLAQILGAPAAYAGMKIQLQNCPTPASVAGYNVIVQTNLLLQASAQGLINSTLIPNDIIDCAGTTGNSMYAVTYIVNGTPTGTQQCYQITSTQGQWNLNTQQPITCSQPPPNPQDGQFNNLNVTGCLSIDGSGCFTPPPGLVLNGKCDGTTNDDAAIATELAAGLVLSVPNVAGPTIWGCPNGQLARFATGIVAPGNFVYDQFKVSALNAVAAQTGFKVKDVGFGTSGRLTDSAIIGCGTACIASGVELLGAVGFQVDGTTLITGWAGHGYNSVNSERMGCGPGALIIANAQDVNIFSSSNEIDWNCKVLDTGTVVAANGNPAYVYSPNAPGGVFATSGSLVPRMNVAALRVTGAANFQIFQGSIKGSFDSPLFWCQGATCTAHGLYLEQSHTSVGTIVTGSAIYAATTAPLTGTNVAVSPNSYTFSGSNVVSGCAITNPTSSGATSLVQPYWIDSTADAVTRGDLANFVFFPPDYLPNSSAASCLGGGILRGMWLSYPGAGYTNVSTTSAPQLQLTSTTPNGGCPNPSADPVTSCTGSLTSVTWPAGTLTASQIAGAIMAIDDSNLHGFDGVQPGYTLACDNSTLPCGEIAAGAMPDGLQVQQSTSAPPSSLALANDVMFSSLGAGQVGMIVVNTNVASIDLSQQNTGGVLTQTNDTTYEMDFDGIFGFGPAGVVVTQYPNGQISSNTVNLGGAGQRTIGNTFLGVGSSQIATFNPTLDQYNLGRACFPGCMDGTIAPPPAQPTIAAGTSGSILPPLNGSTPLAVKVAYFNSAPYGVAGYEGIYPAVFSNNGANYTKGPKVTADGTGDTAITNIQTISSSQQILVTAAGNGFGVGNVVTLTGLTTPADLYLNGETCTVIGVGNTFTCTANYGSVGTANNADTGEAMISSCPGWLTVGAVLYNETVVQVGGTSAARPGNACSVAPGATLNLIFSRAPGDTTGGGAQATLVASGTVGSRSAASLIQFASGTNNSITVTSPVADPWGPAQYYGIFSGTQGALTLYGTYMLASAGGAATQSITTASYTVSTTTTGYEPLGCSYNCQENAQAGFMSPQDFQITHYNFPTANYSIDFEVTPTAINLNENTTINGNLTVTGSCTGCGGGGGGGSGTVANGTAGQFAYYSGTGNTVSGNPNLNDGGTLAGTFTTLEPSLVVDTPTVSTTLNYSTFSAITKNSASNNCPLGSITPAYYRDGATAGFFCIEAFPIGAGPPSQSGIFAGAITIDPGVGSWAALLFGYCRGNNTRCGGENPSAQDLVVHANGTVANASMALTVTGGTLPYILNGMYASDNITNCIPALNAITISGGAVTLTTPTTCAITTPAQITFGITGAAAVVSEADCTLETPATYGNSCTGYHFVFTSRAAAEGFSVTTETPSVTAFRASINTPLDYIKQVFIADQSAAGPNSTDLIFGSAGIATPGTCTNVGSPGTIESDEFSYTDGSNPFNGFFRDQVTVGSGCNPTVVTRVHKFVTGPAGVGPTEEWQTGTTFKFDGLSSGFATISASTTGSELLLNSTTTGVTNTGVLSIAATGGNVEIDPSGVIGNTDFIMFNNDRMEVGYGGVSESAVFNADTGHGILFTIGAALETGPVMAIDPNGNVGFGPQANSATLDPAYITPLGSIRPTHIECHATAMPTVVIGAGGGSGTVTINTGGNDCNGFISLTTAGTPAASSQIATVTFNVVWDSAPKCFVQPSNALTAALTGTASVFVPVSALSTTAFSPTIGSTALITGTAYQWMYHCEY